MVTASAVDRSVAMIKSYTGSVLVAKLSRASYISDTMSVSTQSISSALPNWFWALSIPTRTSSNEKKPF